MSDSSKNPKAGPFEGKIIFQTTNDPVVLLPYADKAQVVAVLPDTTREEADKLRSAGYDVVIWDPQNGGDTVGAVQRLGVEGVILQAEGPEQLDAANKTAAQLEGSGVTLAIATNNFSTDSYPGWVDVAMPYAYASIGSHITVDRVEYEASKRVGGRDIVIIPIVGGDMPPPGQESQNEQLAAAAAEDGTYAIFPLDPTDPTSMDSLLNPPGAKTPATDTNEPAPASVAIPDGLAGGPTGTYNRPGAEKPAGRGKPASTSSSSNEVNPAVASAEFANERRQVFAPPPPSPYQGGAPVEKVLHPDDGSTITITSTGAVIKQSPGGTPYREGWVDPNKISDIDSVSDLTGNIRSGNTNPFTHPASTAFQSTNPGWGAASDAAKAASGSGVADNAQVEQTTPQVLQPVQPERPAGVTGATADQIAQSINPNYNQPPPAVPTTPPAASSSALSGADINQVIKEVTKKTSSSSSKPRVDYGSGATSGGSSDGGGSSQEIYNPPQVIPDAIPVYSGGTCFIAGSKVLTPDGERAIEEIKLGDYVQTWDMDKQQMVPSQVTDTLGHHDRQTLSIETEGGSSITTTDEHPFWTGSEWLAASKLAAGQSTVFDSSGQQRKVTKVTNGPKANVYNFHVTAPAHNYFVEGLLVHNVKAL